MGKIIAGKSLSSRSQLPGTLRFCSPGGCINMRKSFIHSSSMAAAAPGLSCTARLQTRPSKQPRLGLQAAPRWKRHFSTTVSNCNWLVPKHMEKSKSMVGRPRMPTGGSMRGTTVVWGDYGLRMKDHDRRVSAKQLKIGQETIQKRLRQMNYKLYTRVSANIGVYTKGSEVRMGKGKGKFDYWAARIPVNRVVYELKTDIHEKVVREAFRLAGHKLPGLWETVKKGDPPIVGLTKLEGGITLQSLKAARREVQPKDKEPQLIIPPTTETPAATVSPST